MGALIYFAIVAPLCAVYAWYDAPFSSLWYQRLPRSVLAFAFNGLYVLYVLFDGIRTLRHKRSEFQALGQRRDEIAAKHGF